MKWVFANCLCVTMMGTGERVDPPATTIENPMCRLTVLLPDAAVGKYRGQRFDWSGMIAQVEFAGHRLFGPFREVDDPQNHDANAVGTAEEFDPKSPLGYDIAKPGEWFWKIGVGRIRRDANEPYRFTQISKGFEPCRWVVEKRPNQIRFEQSSDAHDGWAWRYVKVVELSPDRPIFVLRRSLKNLGSRAIAGEHYGHHFFRIDNRPVDANYSLKLPMAFVPDRPTKALVHGDRLTLDGKCVDPFMAWFDRIPDRVPLAFSVEHRAAKIRVDVQGDRPLLKLRVYVAPTAFCPEPFTGIHVEPGETLEWSTEYRLSTT